jgi:phosphatidylglycerophosphatase A
VTAERKGGLRLAIVSCGYLGLSPIVPGTFGTLGGVLFAWLLAPSERFFVWNLALCAVLYLVGRSLGAWSETYAQGKDPGFFVLDEVIGYLITVLWVRGPSLATLVLGFFLFRFFDIVKPPPAHRLERLGGGDGILLDDVVAGLYGLAVMSAVRLLVLEPGTWSVS